jgi:hypothetical protein
MRLRSLILFLLVTLFCSSFNRWGFYGHRLITKLAIYTLPAPLSGFYKANAATIIEKSVVPDQRRYVIPEEGPRHYIDLDKYEHRDSIPKYWLSAVERYGETFLEDYGHGPWYTYFTHRKLVSAFKEKNTAAILRLSSDLSHYIADANVPLHTTSNYNGQFTNQHGIHGFWETRLPQLFSDNYDFLVGKAEYLVDPQQTIWQGVFAANDLVDSVFLVEILATEVVGEDQKYGYEDRGQTLQQVYSKRFSQTYHEMMPRVEGQMQRSIKMIGDFWFTAWVEAGQPDLRNIPELEVKEDSTLLKKRIVPARKHEH